VNQPAKALGLPQLTEADRQKAWLQDNQFQCMSQWVGLDCHNYPSTGWATDWVDAAIYAATMQLALYELEQTATVQLCTPTTK